MQTDEWWTFFTMLAARREDGMSNWMGDSFGGFMPMRTANLSTYHAEPMPITSEIVFPKAAAAIVESTMTLPSIISIWSPWKINQVHYFLHRQEEKTLP